VYVANYIPEPEIMPGCVTQERYRVRIQYIKGVVAKLLLVSGVICFLSLFTQRQLETSMALRIFFTVLLLSSLTRTLLRATRFEILISMIWFLPSVISATLLVGALWTIGFPIWAAFIGIACIGIYTAACGRDFSFVGAYVLCLIASNTFISIIIVAEKMTVLKATLALALNTALLMYLLYDLASILSRRTQNDSWVAIVDLFRDVFNVIGWLPRVVQHWYRHRILNDLGFEIPFRLGNS
jgi:membrane-associated HD superfamily phosphohydrolase